MTFRGSLLIVLETARHIAKLAEEVEVHADGHPQIDAPNPGDMQRAIIKRINDYAEAVEGNIRLMDENFVEMAR